ncbi:anoctamin-9 [Puma concolor]|uniref:Anoctamin n=1 Tax=Puma concolor TaxID=9696 RepID=A0A6P6H6M7_PUMCO|nr:anoctamin-9 [Puma concolor]
MPRMRAQPASHSASLGLCQAEESLRILAGTEGDSLPLMEINAGETEASEQWDYVLVADRRTQRNPGQACQQRRFLEELRTKGFHYKVLEDREKVFFGVRADSRIFDLYRTLLMEPEGPAAGVQPARPAPIPATTRIRIVNFVLNSKTAAGDTLEDLVKNGVFETRFALHKGEDDLKKKWAQWRNMVHKQPIDDIRDYFGEKVALYFAWLGWYTYMLVPAAVAGLVIFLSGFSLFNASQIRWGWEYGFTTIFVAAFPLAPLLALFSNLVEIRLDAIKMVRLQRRLVPRKAKDIGTWLQVLETIGVLAVIANGMVIAFTSEFIPRVVYKYHYGPCRKGADPAVDCLTGYINHSLSVFHTKDFQDPIRIEGSENVTECRYRDYRNAQDYNLSEQFWVLLAIRLVFLILFEHVALCIKLIAAWFVPDVPQSVKNKVLEDKYRTLREKIRSSRKSTDV